MDNIYFWGRTEAKQTAKIGSGCIKYGIKGAVHAVLQYYWDQQLFLL